MTDSLIQAFCFGDWDCNGSDAHDESEHGGDLEAHFDDGVDFDLRSR